VGTLVPLQTLWHFNGAGIDSRKVVDATPLFLRGGEVKSQLVLSAFLVPLIEVPQAGVDGKYVLAHA
jgi:hypothetical protein